MEVSTASCSKIRDQQNPQSHLFREDFQSLKSVIISPITFKNLPNQSCVRPKTPQKTKPSSFAVFIRILFRNFQKSCFFGFRLVQFPPMTCHPLPPTPGREVIAGLGPQPSPSRLALTWKPERCHTFLETTRRGMDGMDGPGDHVGHWTFL